MNEQFKVGTVFKWKQYPYPHDNILKDRWFVYLGESSILDEHTIFAYICTTTTQLQHYEPNGDRASHDFIKFEKGKYDFNKTCILDLFFKESLEKSKLENSQEIEFKFFLDKETMKRIYNKIYISKHFSKKEKRRIYESYNRNGITGIKKPK